MNVADLREEIAIELENLGLVVAEVRALRAELGDREPSVREKTAAAAFLAQFYTGVENVLKRISRFCGVPLPTGENWHLDLFKRFCEPPHPPLPVLFDQSLACSLSAYRRFRHVVHHGYGFQLEWERMRDGVLEVEALHDRLRSRLAEYVRGLETP